MTSSAYRGGLAARLLLAIGLISIALPAHGQPGSSAGRTWTLPDIIEVSRIASVAVDGAGREVRYIVRTPSLASDADRYRLFARSLVSESATRPMLTADVLEDLQWRPGTDRWTVRADLGQGLQLYEFGPEGRLKLLVQAPPLPSGGAEGIISSSVKPMRPTGIVAYGWSPDGRRLWYLRLRALSQIDQQRRRETGVRFDDTRNMTVDFYGPAPAAAVELRVLDTRTGADSLVSEAPGDRFNAATAFQVGAVTWTDPTTLAFRKGGWDVQGRPTAELATFDVLKGQTRSVLAADYASTYRAAPTRSGYLTLRRQDGGNHLVEVSPGGEQDRGLVDYIALGGAFGVWQAPDGRGVFGVMTRRKIGLAFVPATPAATVIEALPDTLTACAFDARLTQGVCARERLSAAPDLVLIDLKTASVRVLDRPNARYDAIAPLRSEPRAWTNRFGATSNGFITYPRGYQPGVRYPAVVVTHGADALERFAAPAFQWAFPIQLLAERGYVVLSVNEAPAQDPEASHAYAGAATSVSVARMQKAMGLQAVASMDAAVEAAVAEGLVDSQRAAIIGYSRGGIVTTLALSQSKTFKAGINADTSFFNAGGFWRGGVVRELYRGLFGGGPLDPAAIDNYRAFSPSARAAQFSGPLLQLYTAEGVALGIELDQALKEAKVPTELVGYLDETHILHRPRTIAAAATLSLDWLDYWVSAREDPATEKVDQYRRWRSMAEASRSISPNTAR